MPAPGAETLDGVEPTGNIDGLPGQLPAYRRCGAVERWEWCGGDECAAHPQIYSCGRVGCSVCFPRYARRAGRRIEERITALTDAHRRNGHEYPKPRHVILSPPQDGGDYDPAEFLKAHAVPGWGGVLVYHPARKKHDDGTECDEAECRRPHLWVAGPHWHFIGHYWIQKSDEVFKKTGWTYKNKIVKNREVAATAGYLLTHHAVTYKPRARRQADKDRDADAPEIMWGTSGQTYRYIGVFSNAVALVVWDVQIPEVKTCDCCGDEQFIYQPTGPDDLTPTLEHKTENQALEWTRDVFYIIKRPGMTRAALDALIRKLSETHRDPQSAARAAAQMYIDAHPLDPDHAPRWSK